MNKIEEINALETQIKELIVKQTQLTKNLDLNEQKLMNKQAFGKENTIWDWKYGYPGHSIGLNTVNCPRKMTDIDSMHLDHAGRCWLFEHKFIYRGIEDNQIRVQKGLYGRIEGAKAFVICTLGGFNDDMEPKILELHEARVEYLSIDGIDIKPRYWRQDHWTVGLLLELINAPDYEQIIESWKQNSSN